MDINEFKSRLKSGNLAGAYAFVGEEDYLKQFYIGELRNAIVTDEAFAPFNHIVFDGEDLDIAAFVFTTPYYSVPRRDQIIRFYQEVAKLTKHNIMAYDLPGVTQAKITYDMVIEMIETYFRAGADEKALDLAKRFIEELFVSTEFFLMNYEETEREFDACYNCISYVSELADHFGYKEYGNELRTRFNTMLGVEEE